MGFVILNQNFVHQSINYMELLPGPELTIFFTNQTQQTFYFDSADDAVDTTHKANFYPVILDNCVLYINLSNVQFIRQHYQQIILDFFNLQRYKIDIPDGSSRRREWTELCQVWQK